MNRQAAPSIVLSVLIVCSFAVILYPGAARRSTALQPVVAGQAPVNTAPPIATQPEKLARSSRGDVIHSPEAAKPVVLPGSTGKVAATNVVARSGVTSPVPASGDASRQRPAASAGPAETIPAMGRTESQSDRLLKTAGRRDLPREEAVRVAAKGAVRSDSHGWTLVAPVASAAKPVDAR